MRFSEVIHVSLKYGPPKTTQLISYSPVDGIDPPVRTTLESLNNEVNVSRKTRVAFRYHWFSTKNSKVIRSVVPSIASIFLQRIEDVLTRIRKFSEECLDARMGNVSLMEI